MISYFDRANCAIFGIAQQTCGDDELFLRQAGEVEDRIVDEVCLNIGDVEFPNDLRQKILTVIAWKRINGVPKNAETEGRRIARVMRYSPLIGQLHCTFHELAGRRLQARFGVWTARPDLNLTLRHDYEKAKAREARPNPGGPADPITAPGSRK
jgi:hypothetical protein